MATTSTTPTDAQIQRDVLEELSWDARVAPNDIGVTVRDSIVTLTGWVDGFSKKWAAERTAHRVRGVSAVANDIDVRLPSSAERTDSDVAAAATRALEWDAFVPIEQTEVTVSRGWVTLNGEVEWEFQRREAERAIRRLSGVRGVTNLISVQPRVSPSSQELHDKIEQALVRSAETDAQGLSIEVSGATVVLHGRVRTWSEKEEAARVAWSAPGVSMVDNHITVRP